MSVLWYSFAEGRGALNASPGPFLPAGGLGVAIAMRWSAPCVSLLCLLCVGGGGGGAGD